MLHIKLAQLAVRCALPPRRTESPVCANDNKPSCVLHLLGWFIGSRGFSSLERRPEFWVLHEQKEKNYQTYKKVQQREIYLCLRVNWLQGKIEHTLIERNFLKSIMKKKGKVFQQRTDNKWHQDTAERHN